MTRAVLWKEIREQFAILVALLVMGAGLIVGITMLDPPTQSTGGPMDFKAMSEAPRAVLYALVLVSGMVIGATLFAGEEELRTAAYLYTLPARRARLFLAKVASGLVLAAAVVVGLIAAGWGAGLYGGKEAWLWPLWLGYVAFTAYCTGVAGSTLAKTTLGACGLAIAFGLIWNVVGLLPGLIAEALVRKFIEPDPTATIGPLATLVGAQLFVIPASLVQGFLQFTAPDRQRKVSLFGPGAAAEVKRAVKAVRLPRIPFGIRRLVWITRRQLAKPAIILAGVALVVGLAMLHQDVMPIVVLPVATMSLSALIGTLAFADEQVHGSNRFWSERQLPAGRLWLAKAFASLAVVVGLAILVMVPRVIGVSLAEEGRAVEMFRSGLLPTLHFSSIYLLVIGPMYGLAFGLASGMLFQKPLVAAATAILLAGTTAFLWAPSLVSGGLHFWQIALPPLVVLITARLLTRAWANDRIGTRRGIRTLVGGSIASLLVLALGIGYRAVEIQEAPEGNDDIIFGKTIPTYDDLQPGRDLRAAAARFGEKLKVAEGEIPVRLLGKVDLNRPFGPDGPRQSYVAQLRIAGEIGWPTDRPDLDRWLDRLCEGDWIEKAKALRGRAPGVFIDPNEQVFWSPMPYATEAESLSAALVARGLQLQARGDDAEFISLADAALACIRTGQNKTTFYGFGQAQRWVWPVLNGVDRWLANLDGRPELLRELFAALHEHEAVPPVSTTDLFLAETLIARNSFKAPQQWAYRVFSSRTDEKFARAEVDWLGFAWNVPWEKERLRRLIGRLNASVPNETPVQRAVFAVESLFNAAGSSVGSFSDDQGLSDGLPGYDNIEVLALQRRKMRIGSDLWKVARLRMTLLKVALRLYQQEEGKLPETLDALVPKYLPAVPLDPFDGKPIRYRVSAGEVIYGKEKEPSLPPGRDHHLSRSEFMAVAAVAGSGILWPTAEDPVLPPGRDTEMQLEPERFDAVSAVAGGIVQWPTYFDGLGFGGPGGPGESGPGFTGGPGIFGPGGPIGDPTTIRGPEEYQALASVAGGVVFGPAVFPPVLPPPGQDSDNGLTENQFDAVAAVSGAVVQWPLDPVWKEAPAASRLRIPPHFRLTHEEIEVPAGQALLWCVGPDLADDSALRKSFAPNERGDLVELVPMPPKKGGRR